MNKYEKIAINNDIDIITARMMVREAARRYGLSLTDQSCISLATSSLANAMGMGQDVANSGEILVECVQKGTKRGLRVSCLKHQSVSDEETIKKFGDSRWLVDELEMTRVNSGGVSVALTKWGS
jgi:hypothetical protein